MSKATGETEHLKDMLVGNLLFVSWHDVIKTALLYGAIGVFHYIFRKNFLAISLDHDLERVNGMSVRFWDMLFYGSFGFVVTSSVAIAGVLLPDCPVGRGDAVREDGGQASGNRVDHGHVGFGFGDLLVR